ncbi:MAG: VCBS repeat-containing protein [Deltaproteobacteria bacterium]|nr:VCBS repeat-containing protein [Candidatus Anaeroferrophillacea bacterium]
MILCTGVFPSAGVARADDRIVERLQPLAGYVVESGPQGIVIDRGSSHGVNPGDVFSVLRPGAPLVHPATGQVIGRRDEKLALIKVVRAEAGYAVTVPLGRYRQVPLMRGQMVKRAAEQRLLFIDLDGHQRQAYSWYRDQTPHLQWDAYEAGRQPAVLGAVRQLARLGYDLYLLADGRQVQLFNADGELIGVRFARVPDPAAAESAASSTAGDAGGRYNLSTSERSRALTATYRQAATINGIAYSIDIGDVTGDGQSEVVFTDKERVYVYTLTPQGLKYRYRYQLSRWGTLMNVQIADIDGDRRGEILVNAMNEDEDGFSSFILGYKEGKYREIVTLVPYVLGVLGGFSVADGGFFVGQTFAEEVVYGNLVYRLQLQGDGVKTAEPFAVPLEFRLPGALFEDINHDGRRELCFMNAQNFLLVYQGGDRLWMSDERLGGSLNDTQVEVGTNKVSYTNKLDVPPPLRVVDVNGDRRLEVMVVRNTSAISTGLGEFGFLSKGGVVLLEYAGMGFALRPMTGELEGPVQGINVVENELLVAMVKRSDDLLKTTGDTYLLGFPLRQ